MTGFPLPRPNGTGVALGQIVSMGHLAVISQGINSLGHLLLLLLPLASLQIEERIDLLLFGLRIIKLQHIVGH